MPTYNLHVPTIVCAGCANTLISGLEEITAVLDVQVDVVEKIVTVTTQTGVDTEQTLVKVVQKRGHSVSDPFYSSSKIIQHRWLKGIAGVVVGTALLTLSLVGMSMPLYAMYIMGGLSTVLTFYLGKETYRSAIVNTVKNTTISMDLLFAISTLLAIGVSLAGFAFAWLPMMFDAALLILGFKHIGKAIEESIKQKVSQQTFRSRAVKEIEVVGQKNKVKISAIKPGTIIMVRSGQTVPLNGELQEEKSSIYTTLINGRTEPQVIEKGNTILAGMRVPLYVSFITIKVTATEEESYLAELDREIKAAQLSKSPIESTANQILKYFIPIVFGIAIISAIVVALTMSPVIAIQCAISVLVSACPCTFGLVTPLAMRLGMAKASEQGIHFKTGKSLEEAQQADIIVFDLTGTLTLGMSKVVNTNIHDFNMLSVLAAIEQTSTHPIAQALCAYATKQQIQMPAPSELTITKTYHSGIVAQLNNDTYVVGNKSLMEELGIALTSDYKNLLENNNANQVSFLAKNKQIIGYVLLEDPLRPDAKLMIKQLKQMGKTIHICTGADHHTAAKYAKALTITHIQANCPNGAAKKDYILSLRNKYNKKVAMVGDAGNDAAAIAASDFGIAIQSTIGDQVTQAKAGAVINIDKHASLWSVVNTFNIANATVSKIKQNLMISLMYNMVAIAAFSCVLVALGILVHPAIGAGLMILQTAIVLGNTTSLQTCDAPKKILTLEKDASAAEGLSCQRTLASSKELSSSDLVGRPMHQSLDTSLCRHEKGLSP